MSYLSQWQLTIDSPFVGRVNAALIQQADVFKDDQRPDMAALANALLVGAPVGGVPPAQTFIQLVAAAPGVADTADTGDGTVDSSKVDDADILAAIQAEWPTVAALFYDADGTPR
jgi:hypothetical protein